MMKQFLKKFPALLAALILLAAACCSFAEEEGDPLAPFVLHHGDRAVPKIAITVDDCYESATEWIRKDAELCRRYDVAMTFFPVVYTGCLDEKYRGLWQDVLDSGCEIGTHSNRHMKLGNRSRIGLIGGLGRAQEALDKTLGFHYEIRWFRPPYGSIDSGSKLTKQQVIDAVQIYGFDHVVHWDVSETIDLEKALKDIRNGSILLFHAKKKDTLFLEKLIPELLDRDFELVTMSELFGFDPPETGEELYIYSDEDFQ